MEKVQLYSVFDKKMKEFRPPIPAPSNVAILRSMQMSLAKPEAAGSELATYPEDFAIFEVGSFDSVSGMVLPSAPQFVEEVSNLVAKKGGA